MKKLSALLITIITIITLPIGAAMAADECVAGTPGCTPIATAPCVGEGCTLDLSVPISNVLTGTMEFKTTQNSSFTPGNCNTLLTSQAGEKVMAAFTVKDNSLSATGTIAATGTQSEAIEKTGQVAGFDFSSKSNLIQGYGIGAATTPAVQTIGFNVAQEGASSIANTVGSNGIETAGNGLLCVKAGGINITEFNGYGGLIITNNLVGTNSSAAFSGMTEYMYSMTPTAPAPTSAQ